MDPSSPLHRPRDNIPFHPNDYWDRSRFADPNPTHSLASLPGHIQASESGSGSGSGLKSLPVSRPEARPKPRGANLKVEDARGRTSDRSYAQQLKMRSRSPQFMPFERSASGSRSVVASPTRPDEKQRPEIFRAGSDPKVVTSNHWYNSQPEWGQRPGTHDQRQTKQSQCQSTGKEQDEVVMSSTAYPGQEWTPEGFHGLEYF